MRSTMRPPILLVISIALTLMVGICVAMSISARVTPEEMGLDQKAQMFLQRLYPGEQFNVVCNTHNHMNSLYSCAATRRQYPLLPPIAIRCHSEENACQMVGVER